VKEHDGYRVVPFPHTRQLIIDHGRVGRRKHLVYGLLEVDVTETRQRIRQFRARTGEALSLTSFIIACLGRAIAADPAVQAYRNWRNQFVLFDDVDVTTIIEIELEDQRFPLAHIIRAANRRTPQDIHREIAAIQHSPDLTASRRTWQAMRLFLLLPWFVRNAFYWMLRRNPHMLKRQIGTVGITALGMFGAGGGWGIAIGNHTLDVTLGGVAAKPGVVHGQVAVRQFLSMTIGIDHDMVDGAPVARFARRFRELIERGEGLE
jgi:pyruvate/2-oxoglutarate dehydrogenase complex dihydrolipoamide acyltransferase (E2) component